ncbi:MAG: phage tail tape measure protein [Pseudomonadota bacterium]
MPRQDPFGTSFSDTFSGALSEMRELTAGFTGELTEAGEAMKVLDGQASKLSRSLSSSLRSAFDRAVFGGERLSDVFRGLASSVAGKALDAALQPVTSGLSEAFTGVLGGLGSNLVSGFAFEKGGAFSSGKVRAFAKGGVVTGPTTFPMRGGTGLMGEAGPEAIMPLTRGRDGKLGVAAQGGSAASHVTVNISAQDVNSFQRSRGQIAAQLARAVRQGQSTL